VSKILVRMLLGTSSVSVCGQSYTPDEEGIVELESAEHVGPLVEMGGEQLSEEFVPTPVVAGDVVPASLLAVANDRIAVLEADLETAQSAVADLGAQLADAQARIAELTTGLSAMGEKIDDIVEDKPNFADMTKARLSDWVVANGGEAIPDGNHASHVAAAEAHWVAISTKKAD